MTREEGVALCVHDCGVIDYKYSAKADAYVVNPDRVDMHNVIEIVS